MYGVRSGVAAKWALAAAICGFAVLPSEELNAQSSSQITPPSFRPPLERGRGFALPATPGLTAPAGAEKLFVRLSGIEVEGGRPELAAASEELRKRLTGRRLSAAEIFQAARDLEAAYTRAGFVLVRVVLPAQQLVNGAVLRLVVVDGFVERVDPQGVPERVRARVVALTQSLIGQRGVMLRELERRLLLAGDTPGLILRSTLVAGKEPGGTVLVLEGVHQPVTGLITFDNTLSQALGRWSVGVGVDFNSVASLGELVYLRANGYPRTDGGDGFFESRPRNRALAAGIVVPIGVDGLTFNLEGTDARTTPLGTAGIQTASEFERFSARLRYPWIRSRDMNLNTELVFDAQEERQLLDVAGDFVPLSLDRLRVLRLNTDGNVITPWNAAIAGRVTPSFGISGLGARTSGDASPILPLSRQGADAEFQKLEAFISYTQPLADHLTIDARLRAQTSFNRPLLRSEQFGIANQTGLSTFDAGSLQGDAGYVARGELQSPWGVPFEGGGFVGAPYLFGAFGELRLANPTAVEARVIKASSYGLGIRLGAGQTGTLRNASLTIEIGRQDRDDALPGASRVHVIGAIQF